MKTINDLQKMKEEKDVSRGTAFVHFINEITEAYKQGKNLYTILEDWDECSKIVILGEVYKRAPFVFESSFGSEFLDEDLSQIILGIYKSANFSFLANHNIYCDESMNLRKVKIKATNKMDLMHTFFVLGGLIVPKGVDLSEINQLFPKHTEGEYKYKFFSQNRQLPESLSSSRLSALFDFIIEKDIKIHFNAKNFIYYALTDTIDSLNICQDFEISQMLKSVFYHFLMKSYDETYQALLDYEYPSIPHGKEKEFIACLIDIFQRSFVRECNVGDQEYEAGRILLQLIKDENIRELPLIQDNTPGLLESTFMYDYIQTATIFINNGVFFDIEEKIEEDLKSFDADYQKKLNCSFLDSQTNLGIQLSDAISGFIARLLKMLTSYSMEAMDKFLDFINDDRRALKNLAKFLKIYEKSNDFYKYSICVKMSAYDKMLFDRFVDLMGLLNDLPN